MEKFVLGYKRTLLYVKILLYQLKLPSIPAVDIGS